MTVYSDLDLPEALQHTLAAMEFTKLTPIQDKSIPVAMDGLDILGSAQTGTGKTAAFLVPLINHILLNPDAMGMVVLPTRELAKQVHEVANKLLGRRTKIRSVCLIGGESMDKQLKTLRQNPRIIVGTPGRMNDHLNRRTLSLHHCDFVVLDETDRMLDMGFGIQIDEIFEHMPQERQVLMFSATIPKNIVKLSNKYLTKPVRIAIEATPEQALKIEHTALRLTEKGKFDALVEEINNREGTIIIFGKTRMMTQKAAERLQKLGIDAEAIHGDLRQHKRERIIRNFHAKKFRILVATDVAARGLDIPHIQHVIINDLPQVPEDYIHRIGRTGRNGKEGKAIVFLTPRDNKQWRLIQRILPEGLSANETYGSYEAEMAAQSENNRYGSRNSNDNERGRGGNRNDRVRGDKKRKDNKRKKFFGEGGEGFDPSRNDGAARRITERKEKRGGEHTSDSRPRRSNDGESSYGRRSEGSNDRPRRSNGGESTYGRRSEGSNDRPRRSNGGESTYGRRSEGSNDRPRRSNDSNRSYGRSDDSSTRKPRRTFEAVEDRSSRSEGGFKTNARKNRGDTWADDSKGERNTRRDENKPYAKNTEAKKAGWAKTKKAKPQNRVGGAAKSGEGHAYKPKGKNGPNKRAQKRQMAS